LNKRWRDESTPLCHAVEAGKLEMVKHLVEAGADINAGGWTPLGNAVFENNTAIAEYLLDHGANVNPKMENWGPLHETVHVSNSVEMAKLLIARGANVNAEGYTALHAAINPDHRHRSSAYV